MKTLIITLLMGLLFTSVGFADNQPMALSSELQELKNEAVRYMSDVYSESTGSAIKVRAEKGLEMIGQDLARDVLEESFEMRSFQQLESFIEDANRLTAITAPIFARSICCGCGHCTNK